MRYRNSLIGNPPNKSVRRFIGETLPDLTGFPRDRTDATITIAGNVLTIAPVGASFSYWYQGKEIVKTAAETATITDVEGLHYFYYDENETLQQATAFDIDFIYTQALVAIGYWDAANNICLYCGDERHGRVMSAETHAHLHLTLGTQWIQGLALDGFTIGNGALDVHAQFGYTAGQIRDEDIELDNIADVAPAQISIFYRDGAAGNWRRRAANNFPLIYSGDGSGYVGANGRIPFNEVVLGAWVLTEVSTNNDFALVHYFATNDPDQPLIAFVGQAEYGNINAAREGATTEINNIVTSGLPFAEFTPIGTAIFQTSAAFGNTPKARVVQTDTGDDYVDFRDFKFSSTGSPGSHANLGNLTFAASAHIGFQPIIFEDAGDPDANDDIADTGGNGVFLTGYRWLNTTTGVVFICIDDTAAAAVWLEDVILDDESRLVLGSNAWLMGEVVLDLDFTGTDYDTAVEMLAVGIQLSDVHTPFPDTLRGAVSGTWTYSASDGWRPASGSDNEGPAMLIRGLDRGANWSLEIGVDLSDALGASGHNIEIGYITSSNHVGAHARLADDSASTIYLARLQTNDGDGTYTQQYSGATITGAAAYIVRFRCKSGCVSVWDDQDDAWHDYEGRQSAGIAYSAVHPFIQVRKVAGRTLSTMYISSLKLEYFT